MVEDKLTHDERLRLECLAQAVALHAMGNKPSADVLIKYAEDFEAWVKEPARAEGSS